MIGGYPHRRGKVGEEVAEHGVKWDVCWSTVCMFDQLADQLRAAVTCLIQLMP